MKSLPNQQGSVFFYILIAIALIAALSYALSRGNRINESMLDIERAKAAAQEIMDYGNSLATTTQKLKLRGCEDTQINFENDVIVGYSNPSAPTDKSCDIFNFNGGNVNVRSFDASYLEPETTAIVPYFSFSAASSFKGVGSDCLAESCLDLYAYILVKKEICYEINMLSGLTAIQNDNDVATQPFLGSYSAYLASATTILDEPATNPLVGKTSGCFYEIGDGTPNYFYFQILIAR